MNGSFNSYPSSEYSKVLSKTIFDTSGTYVIPQGTSFLYIFAVAGGGGGGGGARYGSATNSCGGGGGSGGTFYHDLLFAPSIGGPNTTLNISLGAGGTAGSAAASDTSNGGAGGNGGNTTISVNGKTGYIVKLLGGIGGAAGTNSTSVSGGTGYGSVSMKLRSSRTLVGGTGVSTTAVTVVVQQHQDSSGSGGGGVSTSNSACVGGSIDYGAYTAFPAVVNPNLNLTVARDLNSVGVSNATAYASAAIGAAGINSTYHIFDLFSPGLGGGGGGGGASVAAGAGGKGWRGSGGGGGGGSRNGFAAGAGGAGGDGYCVIMALR